MRPVKGFGNGLVCARCYYRVPKNRARRKARYHAEKARDPEGLRRKQRENAAKRYAEDPKKHMAQNVAARRNHAETVRARDRAYYARNPEKYRQMCRDYQKRNPHKFTELRQKRRARLKGAKGKWTAQQWRGLCERTGNICLWCRDVRPLAVDHVIPISLGGSNDISNIQPLCRSCNARKGIKIMDFRG